MIGFEAYAILAALLWAKPAQFQPTGRRRDWEGALTEGLRSLGLTSLWVRQEARGEGTKLWGETRSSSSTDSFRDTEVSLTTAFQDENILSRDLKVLFLFKCV